MIAKSPNRNELCRCHSGKKFKKCCFLKKPHVAGLEFPPYIAPVDRRPKVRRRPGQLLTRPEVAAHPDQPKPIPPKNAEWTDHFFVLGKGWTHERDLQPGDQLRQKDWSWVTYEAGRVVGTTHQHPYFVKGLGWASADELLVGDQVRMPDWATEESEQVIRTTDEHPFFVKGKGWTPANELQPGDELRTEDGWVPVRSNTATTQFAPVYNLRLADDHTYFVGKPEWGFAVWVHNHSYGGEAEYHSRNLFEPDVTGWTPGKVEHVMRLMRQAALAIRTRAEADGRYLMRVEIDTVTDQAFLGYAMRTGGLTPQRAEAALARLKTSPFANDPDGPVPYIPELSLRPEQIAALAKAIPDHYGHLDTPAFAKYASARYYHEMMQAAALVENAQRNGGTVKCDLCGVPLRPSTQSTKKPQRPDEVSFDHRESIDAGGRTTMSNLLIIARGLNSKKKNH